MAYTDIERNLIKECKIYPPNMTEIRRIIESGVNINAVGEDETVLSDIIFGYPDYDVPDECENCQIDEEYPNCKVSEYRQKRDGRYLPGIINLFLEYGYDVSKNDGAFGGKCLQKLSCSSYDKYILDSTKILLKAGADPNYTEDGESVLSLIAMKESAAFCCEHDHKQENLFSTMYEIMDAYLKHKDFENIQYFDAVIGKRIDAIYSFGSIKEAVFDIDYGDGKTYENCFIEPIIIECERIPLCITRYSLILINPNIQMDSGEKKVDISDRFDNCIGQVISDIDFDHIEVVHGTTHYGQTVINIKLSNDTIIRFTDNHGEIDNPRFSMLK